MKYEYDDTMNETYQRSLIKSFKKTIDDGLFSFVLVDMINQNMKHVDEMSRHARAKGFHTYLVDLNLYTPEECFERNVHKRTLDDIRKVETYFA